MQTFVDGRPKSDFIADSLSDGCFVADAAR